MTRNWTYNEGKALISAYENRKDEYFNTKNKKRFWQNILTDLEALNVLESETTAENVEVKWRSLYRAYKSAKDRGTGTTGTKFLYMGEMDEIFHDNPVISSPHSVSVGVEQHPEPALMQIANETKEYENKKRKPSKECLKESILDIKRKYYEEKIEEQKKKRRLFEKYLEQKEKDREDRKQLLLSLFKK